MTSPEALFALVADRPGAVWLDGGDADDGWSVVAWDPVATATGTADWPARGRGMGRSSPPSDAPFTGGVIGYIGFGGATPEPPLWLARYEGAACLRHADRRWLLTGPPALRRDAERLLAQARDLPAPPPATGRVVREGDRAGWETRVEQIREWIAAGDCYQVNLTRAVHVDDVGSPFDAYRRLRRRTARYGAFLRVDPRVVVLSNSPELLLDVDEGRLRSDPIKGTRPRSADPDRDRALAEELVGSGKERAELTMIVDLVRNDLGRVARVGSVSAGERVVHHLPTVHHTAWPVYAELAHGKDGWDALQALFPPGSVTGAPKIRACQRIAELETEPRGVYCGAIGYAADSGRMCWSVAIRVAVVDGPRARYHVGGGIVIDSEPAAEWDETVAKGAALRAALVG